MPYLATLKNGVEKFTDIEAEGVMINIETLLEPAAGDNWSKIEGAQALDMLAKKAKGADVEFSALQEQILKENMLLDKDGKLNDLVKNVVDSAIRGEGTVEAKLATTPVEKIGPEVGLGYDGLTATQEQIDELKLNDPAALHSSGQDELRASLLQRYGNAAERDGVSAETGYSR